MYVYIAPVPGNPVQMRFTSIIISDSDLFQSNTHLNFLESIQQHATIIGAALIILMTILSYQVLTDGGVIQSPHDGIAVEEPRTRDLSVTVPTL